MPFAGAGSASRRRALLLTLVLATALLHALTQARLRPLYQVSDEMAYLRAVQVRALAEAPAAAHGCIAPPDGRLFDLGEGGKTGFRVATAWQLRLLCRNAGSTLPLFALRALQAVSLPVVALAAWVLAWRLSGSTTAAVAAATLVALHPVAAKYAGGVTPDAWATAFSAWALVAGTRLVAGGARWWDVGLMVACTLAGLLWKDTTHFLVPLVAVAMLAVAWRAWRDRAGRQASPAKWQAAAALGLVLVIAGLWGRLQPLAFAALVTPYLADLSAGAPAVAASPWSFTRAVLDDLLTQAWGFAASSLLSLYRPLVYAGGTPWTQALTPWGAAATWVVVGALGLAGALRAVVRPPAPLPRLSTGVLSFWALALALCAVQPSVRLVLLDITGMHQGRWLLPVLAPMAVLLGIGMAALHRRVPFVPAAVVAVISSLWVIVIDLVRHYYVRLPDTLDRAALFTRPTGDLDVGDREIVALVVATLQAQAAPVTWGILVLLAAATCGLAWTVARRDLPPTPHG